MKADEILKTAESRAKEMKLPYKGALTPSEAYQLMAEKGAKLVDVRSRAEWDWVGRVPGAVEIELLAYPGMQPNPNFLNQLKQQVGPDSLVLFMCRSGQRCNQVCRREERRFSQRGTVECYGRGNGVQRTGRIWIGA